MTKREDDQPLDPHHDDSAPEFDPHEDDMRAAWAEADADRSPAEWWEDFAANQSDGGALQADVEALIGAGVPAGTLLDGLWELSELAIAQDYPEEREKMTEVAGRLAELVMPLSAVEGLYGAFLPTECATSMDLQALSLALQDVSRRMRPNNPEARGKAEKALLRLVDRWVRSRGSLGKRQAECAAARLISAAGRRPKSAAAVRMSNLRLRGRLGPAQAPARRKSRLVKGSPVDNSEKTKAERLAPLVNDDGLTIARRVK